MVDEKHEHENVIAQPHYTMVNNVLDKHHKLLNVTKVFDAHFTLLMARIQPVKVIISVCGVLILYKKSNYKNIGMADRTVTLAVVFFQFFGVQAVNTTHIKFTLNVKTKANAQLKPPIDGWEKIHVLEHTNIFTSNSDVMAKDVW